MVRRAPVPLREVPARARVGLRTEKPVVARHISARAAWIGPSPSRPDCSRRSKVDHLERARAEAYKRGVRLTKGAVVPLVVAMGLASCTSQDATRPRPASGIEGVFGAEGGPAPGIPFGPASGTVRVLREEAEVAVLSVGPDGRFQVDVRPGTYRLVAGGPGLPTDCAQRVVSVRAQEVSRVRLRCPIP